MACRVPNVRVERAAASLTPIEADLSRTATSLCPHRNYRPRVRSNALLGGAPLNRGAKRQRVKCVLGTIVVRECATVFPKLCEKINCQR
jgi:hypothetical protein